MKIKERKQKTSQLLAECKKLFPVWSYYSNEELDKQFPIPQELTEREFQDSVEPDKETLGMSSKEAEEKGFTNGITLRERIIMELEYFKKTGKNLDIKGLTFCSGSRCSDGDVPNAFLNNDGKFEVYCNGLDRSLSGYGIRSIVKNSESMIQLNNEENNNSKKDGFSITCKQCGFCRNI
jgi:hypothetical protein